jgi:hypothetical protein
LIGVNTIDTSAAVELILCRLNMNHNVTLDFSFKENTAQIATLQSKLMVLMPPAVTRL